jgi:glycosyltransferase involved in cell wall biosynthesis
MSEFETHPIAALEARALGRPLVVADSSGLRAFAERGEARAVAADASPAEVAQAVLAALRAPPAARAEPPPTWDDCASALLELYREVACAS